MKKLLRIVCSGLLISIVIVTATYLGINVFKAKVVSATTEMNTVLELAAPDQIDQLVRSKYRAEQAKRQTEAEAVRSVVTSKTVPAQTTAKTVQVAKNNTEVKKSNMTSTTVKKQTVAKPVSKPTCDRLIISKIGLNACLATVGLTADGAIGVHASLPAWFNQSSHVGTSSGTYTATFIDGHRSGIFKNLGKLAVGDKVEVTLVSGKPYAYTVRATETKPLAQVDMLKALSIYGSASQGLNLMTCDGEYSSKLGTAERRLIIYATR
jgi:LPXTG-site transpeptidase (sortase) family protein